MKPVRMEIVGLDGNAFNLMGQFQHNARRQGWSKSEIDLVIKDMKSGDYDHLLQVLIKNTVSPDEYENELMVEEEQESHQYDKDDAGCDKYHQNKDDEACK